MKISFFCLVLLCSFISITVESNFFPFREVYTRDGPVRGLLNFTLLNQSPYYSFRGIPYAIPPIGDLRFKAPQPIDFPRLETLNAFDYGHICAQVEQLYNFTSSHEDCLFINVFVPAVQRNERLPVLFYTYPGGFYYGSGDDLHCGPDFLVSRGIILVTFNHRLGMFGFMSLGTPEYSGNMGMKDQQLALKWTYDNIEHFGGDRTRITIGGHSSGSIMSSLQMLNDESKPHIHQALLFSGTANLYFKYMNGDHRCLVDMFAEQILGPAYDYSLSSLTDFLKTVSVEDVFSFQYSVMDLIDLRELTWVPVVENKDAVHPIITDTPMNLLLNATVDINTYIGLTNREALISFPQSTLSHENVNAFMNHPIVSFPINGYSSSLSEKLYLEDLMGRIRDFYTVNATTEFEVIDSLVILASDFEFDYDIESWLKILLTVSTKDTYYQQFSVDSLLPLFKMSTFPGAPHTADMCYIFRCSRYFDTYHNILENQNTDTDSKIALNTINYISELISNFVSYGTPTVNERPVEGFRPVQSNKMNFLNITNDGLVVGVSPHGNRIDFMDQILREAIEIFTTYGDTPKETRAQRLCNEN